MIIADDKFLFAAKQQHCLFNKYLKDVEVSCKTKTGRKIFISFSCSVFQTEIEDLQDFVYIGRNISERQRTQKRLAAQYATTNILSESATLSEATPKILAAIGECLGWDLGELWTTDQYLGAIKDHNRVSTVLRCVETWSKQSTGFLEFKAVTWQTTCVPGVGLPGRVWETRSPYWTTNVVNDTNFLRTEVASLVGLQAGFGFPILSDNEIMGVMTFFSRDEQSPDEDLLQMMAAIGSQVGQFIKRKRAEAALVESEEQYRDLFENASDLIQCFTPNGNFVYVNRAWRKTLGYSQAEIQTMNAFEIVHPSSQSQYRQAIYSAMSGKKINEVKCVFITKDGETVSLEGNINCKFVKGKPVATRVIFRDITQRLQAEVALRYQQQQTERLLLNILPARIAERLKQEQVTIAEKFADVTVLFADIVGFTQLASSMHPIALVNLLNKIFSAFDRLCEQHGLEKIKTIGDAYMVVGGLPTRQPEHAAMVAEMALSMQTEIRQFSAENDKALTMRIGINTGPVVAGVIGLKKFNYDLWGDTVNTASRMESQGLPGQIQVTAATYERLRDQYLFEERGAIEVKGKGKMTAYLLVGRRN